MRLSTTARLSMLSTSLSRIGIQGLQLITFIVVARWLSPADYGTFAVVTLVISMATLFSDFGLQAALIHDSRPSASRLASAFWLNVAVGLGCSALIGLAAFPAELMLGYPDLGKALAVAGFSFALSAYVVPSALLQRDLRLGKLAAIEFAANLAGAITAVWLAWLGFGVVSLSIGPVVTALLLSLMLTVATRYFPAARPTAADVRTLWGFSGSLMAFNATNYFYKNFDVIVLTVTSTPQRLGIYSRAYSLFSAPVTQVSAVVGRVLFPILVQSRDDPVIMKDRWLRTAFASTGIFLPITIAFAVTSPYLINILFEPRWQPMASIVSVLCIAAPIRLITAALGCVYQATGHTRELFRVTLVSGVAVIIGVLAGAPWGPIGVAWGIAISTYAQAYLPMSVGLRLIGMSVWDLIVEFRWITAAGMVQLLIMGGIRLAGGFGSDLTTLLGSLALGLTGYAATGYALDRRYFDRLKGNRARAP